MSFAKLEEIRCPCGEVFEAELWNAINGSEDPDLKEALLCGEINVVCCPTCSQIFYAEHFLLYHDAPGELLAFVYPSSFAGQAAHWATKMKDDFTRAAAELLPENRLDYEPILLFGLDSLVEIIQEDEAQGDEVSILEYAAKDLGLSLIRLKASAARAKRIPRLLPSKRLESGDRRREIIEGLRVLLKYNEHLERYRKLLEAIEQDRNWVLDEGLLTGGKKQGQKDAG